MYLQSKLNVKETLQRSDNGCYLISGCRINFQSNLFIKNRDKIINLISSLYTGRFPEDKVCYHLNGQIQLLKIRSLTGGGGGLEARRVGRRLWLVGG